MKHSFKVTLLLCLVLVAALATSAFTASSPQDDKIVFGGSYELTSGETLSGNLVVLGGVVTLEQGSTVNGDTILVGGTLDANGSIKGILAIIGGSAHLGAQTIISSDVVSVGGNLTRATGSQITGEVYKFGNAPLSLTIPGIPEQEFTPEVAVYQSASFMWQVITYLGMVVFTAALAMLIVLLWSKATQRVANAIVKNPIGTGGFGCLTLIVAPGLLVLVAMTLILSPLSLLGFLLLLAAVLFGWTAINLEVGNRLAKLFKVDWSTPIAAGIGALAFNLIIFGLAVIPCFGWALIILVVLFSLGGVLITRFGTHNYPEPPPTHPLPVAKIETGAPYPPAINMKNAPSQPEVRKPAVVKPPSAGKTSEVPKVGSTTGIITKSKPAARKSSRTTKSE